MNERNKPNGVILCRGCHSTKSTKCISTYLCPKCKERWRQVRRAPVRFPKESVPEIREAIKAFIANRDRYVWQQEVALWLAPFKGADLKKHGIKVATLCREMGYLAPREDAHVLDQAARAVSAFREIQAKTGAPPAMAKWLKAAKMDFDTLHACVDVDELYDDPRRGTTRNIVRRFKSEADFKAELVNKLAEMGPTGTLVRAVEALGLTYKSFRDNFPGVSPEEVYAEAKVPQPVRGGESKCELAVYQFLCSLFPDVLRQHKFDGLVGISEKTALRVDIFVPSQRLIVEVDGVQHTDPKSFMFKDYTAAHDRRKDEYARTHGYKMLRVPHRHAHSQTWLRSELQRLLGDSIFEAFLVDDLSARGCSTGPIRLGRSEVNTTETHPHSVS